MPFLQVPGSKLFYTLDGHGDPPMVLVHGGFCSHADWKYQVRDLAPEFTVVTPDLRGHGASAADPRDCRIETYASDIQQILRGLGLPPCLLVGHSMACRVVLQATASDDTLIAGIGLVDGSAGATGTLADIEQRHAARFSQGFARAMLPAFENMFSENSDLAERDRILSGVLSTPREIAMALTKASWIWDVTELRTVLGKIRVPALAVQSTSVRDGERRSLPARSTTPWLDLLSDSIPGVRHVIVPDAGHFTMLDAPQRVSAELRTFARSL
jgi:pimeloyl-ACP methyl ester carboxylesterase